MNRLAFKQLISETVTEVMYEQMLPEGISPSSIIPIEKFVQSAQIDEADGEFLGAKTSTMSPEEMQAYLGRIKRKEKSPTDKYRMPFVHGSNIEIKNEKDQSYDLDRLRASIMVRPKEIVKQNAKMSKSSGPDTIFFDIGLPALKGLAVNEKTGGGTSEIFR